MKRLLSAKAPGQAPPVVPGRDADERSPEARAGRGRNVNSYLSSVLESIVALGGAFAVSVFLTWPLLPEFGDHIYGLGGDSTGSMAGFRQWADEIGYHISGVSHVASAGAPFGYDQGNGVNLQSAFVFFPAYLLTEVSNEIIAYNIVVLAGLTLSGAAMYWLVRWLGCGRLVAAWAGLVFIVFPWHLEKAQGHPTLAHLEGFPLLLLAVFAWYRKPGLPRALLVAAASAVLWTTSGYFGLMGLAALPAIFLLALVFYARSVGLPRAVGRVAIPAAASVTVPLVVYGIASSGASEDGIATPRNVQELVFYGARPWEFLIPSYRNWLFGDEVDQWLVARLHGSNFSETSLYVGWITIVLAAGWLLWAFLRRSQLRPELRFATLALAATVVTGLVFSLPTPFFRTEMPTPVRLIWEVAPQFRVPARFVALVMAALVPLAALALDSLRLAVARRVQRPALAAVAAAAVCVVAGVLSFLELSISPATTVTELSAAPPEYQAVRRAPPGLVAEYPLARSNQAVNSDYLFWQRAHDRRIVNGAPLGTFGDAVGQTLVDPATPGTAEALAALGVSVAVMRPAAYAFTGGPTVAATTPRRGYRLLAKAPNGAAVLQVTAKPAPAIAAFASGFYSPESIKPGSTMRWMGTTGTIELYARNSGVYRATFTAAAYARPRRIRIEGQDDDARRLRVPPRFADFPLSLYLPRGRSSLVLTSDPGAEALPDGRQATIYMSNWTLKRVAPTGEGPTPLVPLPQTSP